MRIFFNLELRILLAMLSCFLLVSGSAHAQDSGEEIKRPKVELVDCKVRVTDPDGNPVKDATVFCTGLRTRQERGSHWGWPTDAAGTPAPRVQTDADGIATMQYPKYVVEKMETGWMTWSVNHPDFIAFREDRDVTDDPAEIQLKRGFRVALTAIDAKTKEKIKEDLFAVIGLTGGAKWELKKNGMLVSGVYEKRKCFLRVMKMSDGAPTLFSKMITVEPGERSRVLLRDIELFAGTRLEGILDESIPRPIKNGFVVGATNKKAEPNDWDTQWNWSEKVQVKEDGSFVFKSLPQDSVWQMIPICDGFVPGAPTIESIAELFPDKVDQFENRLGGFNLPQLVKLDGDAQSVELAMKPAASIKLSFVDPEGNPLEGVQTGFSPNHLWFEGGSTILGSGGSTRDYLEKQRRGEKIEWERDFRYSGVSDASGVAVIKGLPPGNGQDVYAFHEKFELPISNGRREKRVDLAAGEMTEVKIPLQERSKGPKLGDEVANAGFDLTHLWGPLKGVFNWVW